MNNIDQDLSDRILDILTPFRVVDDGTAFRAEIAMVLKRDGEVSGYRFPVRVYAFEHVVGLGPYFEPRIPLWQPVPGPLTEVLFSNGICEFIRADPEEAGKAWLRYRKTKRTPYIAALLTNLFKMATNEKKPVTYLGQVMDNKFFAGLIVVLAVVLTYTGILKVFVDWNTYDDPWSAKGTANWLFYVALVMLAVIFLVPLLGKEYVTARRTQAAQDAKAKVDASGFYIGQTVAYIGPYSDGKKIQGIYRGFGSFGLLRVSLDGVTEEEVHTYEVYNQ